MSNPKQQTAGTRRKTIQLEAVSLGRDQGVMFALCNDGTIWFQRMGTGDSEPWEKIDEPPQPDPCGMDDVPVVTMPDCNRCGHNDNVARKLDADNNTRKKANSYDLLPFNCLHCGREWFGSFVTPEKPESDQ